MPPRKPSWWWDFLTTAKLEFSSLRSTGGTVGELLDSAMDPTLNVEDLTLSELPKSALIDKLARYSSDMVLAARAIAENAVADVEDLNAALVDAPVGSRLRKRLTQIRERRLAEVPGVPVSVAARTLGLTPQTVRVWLGVGVLEVVSGSRPLKVSTGRLAEVVSLVERLRVGRDRDLLSAVVDHLEDERVLAHRRVRRSLEQLRRGQVETLSVEDL